MDLYSAKENIQPLATGRNISLLQASLRQDAQELLNERKEHENSIRNYEGDDPLEPWYAYISWIEQTCPSGGKESGLNEVLSKCIAKFQDAQQYYQDRRMIKCYIKFLSSMKDPLEVYQQLFNAGIGTMVADFYIAWAYCYDLCGNFAKANEIFQHGIACHAEPIDDLKEAHHHFGYAVAQRFLLKNEEKAVINKELDERRLALTSLRSYSKKGLVGSIRTGAVVKNVNPGRVKLGPEASTSRANAAVNVFQDENTPLNILPVQPVSEDVVAVSPSESDGAATIRSIIDASRNQENMKEPGPWNEAHDKKHAAHLFPNKAKTTHPGFQIHVDKDENTSSDSAKCLSSHPLNPPITGFEDNLVKPFKLPLNFVSRNKPCRNCWTPATTTETAPDPKTLPRYKKCHVYPRPNEEFQPEELMAYNWFQKRCISNAFTKARDPYWQNGMDTQIRLYPNFAKEYKYRNLTEIDAFYAPPRVEGLNPSYERIYDIKNKVEYSLEELYAMKRRNSFNKTIIDRKDMEETVCLTSEHVQKRKSLFPSRTGETETRLNCVDHEKEPRGQDKLGAVQSLNPNEEEKEKAVEKKVSSSGLPFEIYTEENDKQFDFKPPALPQLPTVNRGMKAQGAPHPQLLSIPKTGNPAGQVFFEEEATCSTQTFNFFLKNHAVSTPKSQKPHSSRQFGKVLTESKPQKIKETVDLEVRQTESTAPAIGGSPRTPPERERPLKDANNSEKYNTSKQTTSSESNRLADKQKGIDEISINLEKTNINPIERNELPATPALGRLAASDPNHNEVGNFTRLLEREDTANALEGFKPIRFPEEKTETITKFMLLSKQDDKTETITKMYFQPTSLKFEDEKTSTGAIPKINIQVPTLPLNEDSSHEDYFDFFTKSPPQIKAIPDKNAQPMTGHKPNLESESQKVTTGIKIFEDDEDLSFLTKPPPKSKARNHI